MFKSYTDVWQALASEIIGGARSQNAQHEHKRGRLHVGKSTSGMLSIVG